VRLGYAAFDGRRFALRPRVLGLGNAYLSAAGTWEVARPFLEELVRETRESCSASELDGSEIVHVARFPAAHRIMSITVKVGDRFPAHASAMGRVLLAALPAAELERYFATTKLRALTERTVTDPRVLRAALARARKQGHAEVDGELEIGLRSVAVPITDAAGRTLGAIAISLLSAPASRSKATAALLAPIRTCAERIRRALPRPPAR
jgi:IclR family pca regulon transcriptional regulator